MKKGLTITLALIAVVLSGVTGAFAYAPVMGQIPDVYVGDAEDNLTMDLNYFNLPDAYDFRDYVLDWDDATTTLLWSFRIAGAVPGITKINGLNDLGAPPPGSGGTPVNPNPARELTQGGTDFTPTYRHYPYFPPAFPPLPAPPPSAPTTNTVLTYFASDGTTADSCQAMLVWVDGGTDNISYSVEQLAAPTYDFSSDGTADFGTFTIGGFTAVTFDTGGGTYLAMESGAAGSYFGRYFSNPIASPTYTEIIPYHANSLYRLRYGLRTTQADDTLVPGFRAVSGNSIFTQIYLADWTPTALSAANEGWGLSSSINNFDLYVQLPDQATNRPPDFDALLDSVGSPPAYDFRTMTVSVDLLDASATQLGKIFCDEVTVDRFDRGFVGVNSDPQGPIQVITDVASMLDTNLAGDAPGAGTWQRTDNPDGSVTVNLNGSGAGASDPKIALLDSGHGDPLAAAVLWRESNYLQGRDVMYRAVYRMAVPGGAGQARTDWTAFRSRWNSEIATFGGIVAYQRGGGVSAFHTATVPPVQPSVADYPMVWSMPPVPQWIADDSLSLLGGAAPTINLAFDGVNDFDNAGNSNAESEGGSCTLYRIEVEAMPVPQP
jgi:hypothetical protein